MIRLPSPAMCVAVCSTVIALGGAGYSATGGYFILGRANTATTASSLTAHINGRTLQLTNVNAGTTAYPLAITSHASRPPMFVTSPVRVANLNVDRLDDLDSTHFTRFRSHLFGLAADATSAAIALPVSNRPVILTGMTITGGAEGVGQVALGLGVANPHAPMLAWTGQDSYKKGGGGGGNVSGASIAEKDHIVFIDQHHEVEVRVHSAGSVHVQNNAGVARLVRVTLMW